MAVGSDGDHDCSKLGSGGRGDSEFAVGHGVCSMDRDWRCRYSCDGHCAIWGVCGLEQAGLPGSDRHGNHRTEVPWRRFVKQALLIVDVQSTFHVSPEILNGISELSAILPSVVTIGPLQEQLGWKPGKADDV